MATFTVDLLTGKIYLFNGDFTGSGSTPTSGSTYQEANTFSELPSAGSYSGQIYVVRNASGDYVVDRKESGLYYSNGTTWRRLGDIPSFFNSDNFQVYDSDDNTKGVSFVTSGISTNNIRRLTIQNSDGTIAYLTDLETKVDTTIFNEYTGTTAPNTFLKLDQTTPQIVSVKTIDQGTYTVISSDLNKQLELTGDTTITLPSGLTDGFNLSFFNLSGGTVQFTAGTGANIFSVNTGLNPQYSQASAYSYQNNWRLYGDLT
jgi:hypothetical protein